MSLSFLFLRFRILDVFSINNYAFNSSHKYKMAIQFITGFSLFWTLSPQKLRIMHNILKKELKHWDDLKSKLTEFFWHQTYGRFSEITDVPYLPKYEELCELRDLFNVCAKNDIYLSDMFHKEDDEEEDNKNVENVEEDFYLNTLF